MLRFLTAGESHGKALVAILEGIPSGLKLQSEDIDKDLKRRQRGYGRGGRMSIEKDRVEILSGVRFGKTLGSPIALLIRNLDWPNWSQIMSIEEIPQKEVSLLTSPRPGHADLSGAIKYNFKDIRCVLERASARETAARVAVGSVCRKLLEELGIYLYSRVIQIGKVKDESSWDPTPENYKIIEDSPLRCLNKKIEEKMISLIDEAKKKKDTLGGIFEIVVKGVPPGLGSYIQWDNKLDARLAKAIMSIQAIKGVEVGIGFQAAQEFGSYVQDEIFYKEEKLFYREKNNAGGIEGGISNGEPIILRAAMKPISTLAQPLRSVDIITKKRTKAIKERADVCAVPSAAVIGEAVVSFEIVRTVKEKFGGDSLQELKRNYQNYLNYLKSI
ncbi:chorismate synthase [Candidatus Aerophobetes bacterium]|nr:chorismate synthase [Candidatus Aerophobetes bacterium]